MNALKKTILLGASFLVGLPISSGVAAAQESGDNSIVVTGTAIRGVAPVGSATVNISKEELLESGVRDAALIIKELPQGSGLGFSETNSVGGGQGVNLRGLGTGATLVMFDGHRLVGQGVTDQFADPNQIPFSAISRVEVVTDGASAIYGSDAVAGVVNYLLRKKYDGLEVTGRYVDSIYESSAVEALGGKTWDSGGMMAGVLYEHRGTFIRGERDYLKQDLRKFGGNDNRNINNNTTPGVLGNIVVGNNVYGIPNLNGVRPTAAQLTANLGNPNLVDSADYLEYQPDRKRFAGMLRLQQDIGSRASVEVTSLYSRRHSDQNRFDTATIPIPTTSPYYVPGLTTGALSLQYNLGINLDSREIINKAREKSWNNYVDLRVDLTDEWQSTTALGYGVSTACGNCGARSNPQFTAVAANPEFASLFNPYLAGAQTPFLNRAYGFSDQRSRFRLSDIVQKIDGPLFRLPAGQARLAVGGEYTEQSEMLQLTGTNRDIPGTFVVFRDTKSKRTIRSGFAEMFLPLVGSENALWGVDRLDASVAVRYDKYSDFGATTNPKVGLTYEPFGDLTVRGSWGTSFRAPTLTESNPGVLEQITRNNYSNNSGDPSIPLTNTATRTSSVMQRIGNTPGLQPETANIWSLGGDYSPSFLPGFRLNLTYYNVEYKNRIEALPNVNSALSSAANRQLYSPFIIVAPQPTTCVNGNFATYNPIYLPYVTSPNSFTSTAINDCQLTAVVLGGQRNLGQLNQDGLDIATSYRFETNLGRITLALNGSKIFNLDKSFLPGDTPTRKLDRIGFQVSERANGRLNWQKGPLSATLGAEYTGSYVNDLTIAVAGVQKPATRVPSWTAFNASFSYEVPKESGMVWTRGIRASLAIDNFTDKDPPIVLSGGNAVDAANADVFGRTLTFELTKSF